MRREDAVRIRHMLDAAELAQRFIAGRVRSDLDADDMLLFALVRAIEVIGEAASRVTPETRAALPEIPWVAITGMRNRLIHAYFDIDRDILWKTAAEEIPELIELLKAVPPGGSGQV
jgi:uncharacterized protein with HEPN domain